MDTREPTAKALTLEELPDRREKTEALSRLFQKRLSSYLDTLRPLIAPARLLGRYVGAKEDLVGAEKAASQLREMYDAACGRPFSLSRGLEDEAFGGIENRVELLPWEYSYEVVGGKERKQVTITSPVRWILTYASGCTLPQLKPLLGRADRPIATIRQFIVNALAMNLSVAKHAGVVQILNDLRYEVRVAKSPDLGELPVVTVSACIPSFRPADDLILAATRLTGVSAFIELIDLERLERLEDPIRKQIGEILA